VLWSADGQTLRPRHTDTVEAVEVVQAGQQELVADIPCLVLVEATAQVVLSPKLVLATLLQSRGQPDTP
jgi:hypothetical protein